LNHKKVNKSKRKTEKGNSKQKKKQKVKKPTWASQHLRGG
jgi:hypothetical protein